MLNQGKKNADKQCQDRSDKIGIRPEPSGVNKFLRRSARVVMAISVLFLSFICVSVLSDAAAPPVCACWTYIALSTFLIALVAERWLGHDLLVHKARMEDGSEIAAMIREADNVQPRLRRTMDGGEPPEKPEDFEKKKSNLDTEVQRLKKKLSPDDLTDYQVLPLDQLLIDFLPIQDLKARALSSLVELEEYAEGDAFSYDARLYQQWKTRIDEDIEKIDDIKDDEEKQDRVAEKLRADLRSLLEHVVNYESNWARGKTTVNSIRLCGAATVLVFLVMGVLGIVYPGSGTTTVSGMGIFHWGFLGLAGATTSVLLGLRNSNEVEVGNTRGDQELWRAVVGAVLGFVAGILIFALLAGGLITKGAAVPTLESGEARDVFLSIAWAVVAGMGFENIFQRVGRMISS